MGSLNQLDCDNSIHSILVIEVHFVRSFFQRKYDQNNILRMIIYNIWSWLFQIHLKKLKDLKIGRWDNMVLIIHTLFPLLSNPYDVKKELGSVEEKVN